MFLIYRNRSANIGIEMKLKKLLPKMIKDKIPFLSRSLNAAFSVYFASSFRKTKIFEQKLPFV